MFRLQALASTESCRELEVESIIPVQSTIELVPSYKLSWWN